MTLEAIINKINKETSENVNKILKASKKESGKINRQARQELHLEREHERKNADKSRAILRDIHLSNARRIARRTVLGKKEELINECFDQAKVSLQQLSGDEYNKTIRKLINNGMKLIGNEAVVIPSGMERSGVESRNLSTLSSKRFLDSLQSLEMT